jgi:F0F1-type ATP synthase membrane subunit b/b'
MTDFLPIIAVIVIAAVAIFILAYRAKNQIIAAKQKAAQLKQEADQKITELTQAYDEARQQADYLQSEVDSLSRFKEIRDVAAKAEQIRSTLKTLQEAAQHKAQALREAAEREAAEIRTQAAHEANAIQAQAAREGEELRKSSNADAKAKRERADATLANANQQASQIIQDANQRAEQIAGDAYRALKEADRLKEVTTAMKNVIEGYGDRYLKPTYSLLDELADAYGFDDAGQQLKQARERSKLMVEHDRAATCDYVEKNRRETAVRFVVDAFNGKVDSILSRTRAENFGTLEQQIRDAFALVNNNGAAFRNARISEDYLQARLTELKWATAVQALRDREREEQRRIRDQMREEEKARREIERALKESAREEESLQKAMEKVQAQVAKASEAQRAEFEAKLAEIQAKLAEAEARNQRALSMAQQTKAGHVYIISNIGSFGEDLYKVGMTRRLEPLDRVRELGDASVPFGFDVHAMIWSEDAPALETELHKRFVRAQVNKVNPRKEFFRLSLADLRKHVETMGIEASWTMTALAAEYRESLAIEQRLRENPIAAQDWLRHQLDYQPAEELSVQAEEA